MSVDEASPQSDTEDVAAERGLSRRLLLGGGAAALAAVSTPLAFGGTVRGCRNVESRRQGRSARRRRPLGARLRRRGTERGRRGDGPRRLRRPGADPVGRPDPARRAGVPVRRHEHRRRAGAAVRHGPRRDGVLPAVTQAGPARGQPRGVGLGGILFATAAGLHRPGDRAEGTERPRRQRVRARAAIATGHGASCGRATPAASRRTPPMELTGPGRRAIPRCRRPPIRPARAVLGTFNNCANGADAVGHLPDVRGELQRLLRHREPRSRRRR